MNTHIDEPQEQVVDKTSLESPDTKPQHKASNRHGKEGDVEGNVGGESATSVHENQIVKRENEFEQVRKSGPVVELDDGKEATVQDSRKPKAHVQDGEPQPLAPSTSPRDSEHAQPAATGIDGAAQATVNDIEMANDEDNSQGGPTSASGRMLNVTDALSYLDAVKQVFIDQPTVYNNFLDIMKDFKGQRIDTPGVIERVSNLFKGHPLLIQGFNTFLPAGYRIECNVDQHDTNFITVTTPSGTTVQSQPQHTSVPPPPPESQLEKLPPPQNSEQISQAMQPAMEYVTRIKQRFAGHADLYQEFLDILNQYKGGPTVDEAQLATRIAKLFQHAPDLLSDFQVFMPRGIFPSEEVLGALDNNAPFDDKDKGKQSKKKVTEIASTSTSSGQKKRKKAADREKERTEREREIEREREREQREREMKTQNKMKRAKHHHPSGPSHEMQYQQYPPASPYTTPMTSHTFVQHYELPAPAPAPAPVPQDEMRFFDRVRRALPNRDVYNEFLKLVNLFTQEIIDMPKLVRQASNFLPEELSAQFKEILGWDATLEESSRFDNYGMTTVNAERTTRENLPVRSGPSYRRLPKSEANVTCSGRDEMCKSVLNDEWVCHPTWASEDSGFVAHRKNTYEEALHRSEEERHEYDFHIEAISRAIALLEPYHAKIMQFLPEERPTAKVKIALAGVNRAILYRIIKKIYGREAGSDVLEALVESPGIAIPIVLTRLKQKEEEWKTAQREWNKVWREVDARNYQKSLDHQGISFKVNDKKVTTSKAFVTQIEAAKEEQLSKRAALIDPLFARTRPRYHLSYVIEDTSVLQDCLKLCFSFMDRLQHQAGYADRRRFEGFLRYFVPMFFMLDSTTFNSAFIARSETRDMEHYLGEEYAGVVDEDEAHVVASTSRSSRNGRRGGNDLRKKLLKSNAQDKGSKKGKASAPNGTSRHVSPGSADGMIMYEPPATISVDNVRKGYVKTASTEIPMKTMTRRGSFFCNTAIYALLRLLELLYSRLLTCKEISARLSSDPSSPYVNNPVARELALVDMDAPEPRLAEIRRRPNPAAHFYEFLLVSCERLFDNEIDQQTFEDVARYMFGTKAYLTFTIDKLLGSIIRQVQSITSDTKSLQILEGLKKERENPEPSVQDQDDLRSIAERVIGAEENLFRADWAPTSNTMTFQLLGKDDASYDDYDLYTGRWSDYIDSFVSDEFTKGLSDVKPPFLTRNLRKVKATPIASSLSSHSGLEIKICVRTYKTFYVPHSEDFLWREWSAKELEQLSHRMDKRTQSAKQWLERFDKEGVLARRQQH